MSSLLEGCVISQFSYDEQISSWDKRNLSQPTKTLQTGGGVWRIKFNPFDSNIIATACMYNGFKVYDWNNSCQGKGRLTK